MIRAAIVGLGWWGQNLVSSVRGSAVIRFTTAHTRTGEPPFCAEAGLRWVGSLDEVLADPAIDAVVFATPHTQHAAQVIATARAGKAVFVEKPFTLSLRDADAALDAASRAGVPLAVGFNRRFHPSMARLRRLVRDGALGTLVTLSAEQTALHGLALTPAAWRAQPHESPAGAMTAIGVHLVDGMIDLAGEVTEVIARVARRAAIADDTTDLLLRFASGASGHIFCSTVATPHYRMAAYGTGGFAEILGHPMASFRHVASVPGEHRIAAAPEVMETPGFNMLTAELEAFAACVADGTAFPTPLTEIRHGVAVFEAVLRAAAWGRAETVQRL